jgi:hypothetical protein
MIFIKLILLFYLCMSFSVTDDFDYTPVISDSYYRTKSNNATIDYNFHKVPTTACTYDEGIMFVVRAGIRFRIC